MNFLITSDWHLGHSNIGFLCNRSWNWTHRLELNFNLAAEKYPDATLLHLGDVLFAQRWNHDLRNIWPGPTICMIGNHDRQKEQKCIREAGWILAENYTLPHTSGQLLLFTHRPQDLQRGSWSDIGVYGHKHNSPLTYWETQPCPNSIRISPEFMDYRPIHLDDLLKLGETPVWHAASERWYGASAYPEKLPIKEMGPNHRD